MKRLEGRVAIVTGAGRGLGRAYALALAKEGASVLVNDKGCGPDGEGTDPRPAEDVAAEICALGGSAIADFHDVANWQDARAIVEKAVGGFGDLHVLVNNAGIMRDRGLAEMEETDWDMVLGTHAKGTMALTRWAMAHWDAMAKAGRAPDASIINTSSIGGVAGLGNANYSAAKAAITSLGIITALEGAKIGVRANVVSPNGRTRLTLAKRGDAVVNQDPYAFDFSDPENVAPLIVYLAQKNCPVTGAVFHVAGNQIGLLKSWSIETREAKGRWSAAEIEAAMPDLLGGKVAMPSNRIDFAGFGGIIAKAKAALE